eukprot:15354861-Ditylum_brightwellii.AAC.1
MKYYMNTAYSVSTETNQHDEDSPIHGSGQGAMDAPPGWGFTSHICLTQYDKKAHSCVITDPTGELVHQRNADMFVDDMTAQHNGGIFDLDENTLMELAHHGINLWDSMLDIAGGY